MAACRNSSAVLRSGALNIARISAATSPRPVLLVHGTADSQVPVEQAYQLKNAGGDNIELSITEGADHLVFQGDGTGPEDSDFRRVLLDFLARTLQ